MFRYEDFINGTNDIKRSELLRYMESIGITTDSSNGSSHLRLTNAAGSRQGLPMHNTPVDQGTRHSVRKFIDEHFAALAPKQEDAPPPPVIHIEDEDAIDAAGLCVHALSQEDRTVTLTDARYPEIAVRLYLHDDLLVSDSHIKAATAERDALVATYQTQLKQLKAEYNIGRTMVDGRPRLQVISKNSGYKKTGTQDVPMPSLEECDTPEALTAARDHAVAEIAAYATAYYQQAAQPARLAARPAAQRISEFEALRTALATVGLVLEEKRIDATRVAYDCRYMASTFSSLIEGMDARKMQNKTPGELRQLYPGVDEATLHRMLEVHSSKGAQMLCVVDNHNDGAPSEEAISELKTALAKEAPHRKKLLVDLLKSRDCMTVQTKDDGITYYCFPLVKNIPGKPRIGVATHAQFEYMERPDHAVAADSPLPAEVMKDLTVIDRIRLFDGFRRYEQQLVNALGKMGVSAVFVEDSDGMGVSLRNGSSVELVRVPVVLNNINGLSPYLIRLGQEVGRIYKSTLPAVMAGFGWQPVRETAENVYYKHQGLPDEVAIPCYSAALLNHDAVMDALGTADHCMQRAETKHVDNERATEYNHCVGLLKQLGYREVINGATKLFPPRDVHGLTALVLRNTENYTVKQSDLRLIIGELQKADAVIQKQQELIGQVQQAFGDHFSQDETGIMLQVATRKGDKLVPQHIAFAATRSGEPSPYFSVAATKQLTMLMYIRNDVGFAQKYAQRSDNCTQQR